MQAHNRDHLVASTTRDDGAPLLLSFDIIARGKCVASLYNCVNEVYEIQLNVRQPFEQVLGY